MSTQKLTDRVITGLDASKLSGALPAVDGSALTNMPGITKSASDPATDTNPSGGLGTLWANTTSGELFGLTDATTDSNVWTNIGAGEGDVSPWNGNGTQSGYASGGWPPNTDTIQKFSFTSDANATDVGNLTQARQYVTGHSSFTHGYASCGNNGGDGLANQFNIIDKWAFASDANATDVGDSTQTRYAPNGQSSSTHGYTSGGYSTTFHNVIDKFPFASNANATDVGDQTAARHAGCGNFSKTHGYNNGGHVGSYSNIIDKFTFASNANATDVGDMTSARTGTAGCQSTSYGYVCGGQTPTAVNTIDKFSFVSDGNATDVADLVGTRPNISGSSSTTHGYVFGGVASPVNNDAIDKFSFASNANATTAADLFSLATNSAGSQY